MFCNALCLNNNQSAVNIQTNPGITKGEKHSSAPEGNIHRQYNREKNVYNA